MPIISMLPLYTAYTSGYLKMNDNNQIIKICWYSLSTYDKYDIVSGDKHNAGVWHAIVIINLLMVSLWDDGVIPIKTPNF